MFESQTLKENKLSSPYKIKPLKKASFDIENKLTNKLDIYLNIKENDEEISNRISMPYSLPK